MAPSDWRWCGLDIFLLIYFSVCAKSASWICAPSDIYASIHPNPRIAGVNLTHSGWKGYVFMMFVFGFIWGCVNLAVVGFYFVKGSAFSSGRKTLFTLFIMAPVAVFLILGPFFSPFIGQSLAQQARDRLLYISSSGLMIIHDSLGSLEPWMRQLPHSSHSWSQDLRWSQLPTYHRIIFPRE